MITCNLMGGLGNQIFQIFATISYAIKSGNQFKFLNVTTLGGGSSTIRYTFWDTFFTNLRPFLIHEIPPVHVIPEKSFSFNELPIDEMMNRNILIYGYFQSYKYFQENYNTICRIVGIEKLRERLLSKINLELDSFENTISLHFRIGDYKKIQECHPLATYNYYEQSLNHIKTASNVEKKYTVLFFCEDVDIDDVNESVAKLRAVFPDYTFKRGEKKLKDWEQLILMSCCHHNIIANSSFSWWGAYLNPNQDKIVCYPSLWFGATLNHDTSDLCPPEWIKIEV